MHRPAKFTSAPWPPHRALALVACAPVLPQILGSIFNIWYNTVVIGPLLNTEALRERFMATVIAYNIFVYPLGVGLWIWLVASLLPAMREMLSPMAVTDSQFIQKARRRVINLPWWGGLLAGVFWLLCIPVFLGALVATGDPIKPSLFVHLPISFMVSALISITHSFFLIELVSHRLVLPVLFHNSPAHTVPGTLKLSLRGRGVLWIVSAAICPISSLLLLSFAPRNPGMDPQWFALFVGSVGIAFGICTALMVGRLVGEPIDMLSNAARNVAAGQLDTHVLLHRPDEFGLLISEFNHMIRELREKKQLRETFGLHVGSKAAERILARDPGLGGARETLTVMFCDIRDYTSRCANQPPESTVNLLNAFFEIMVQIVEETHGGMINQLTGDGFMALFGAYGSPPRHADAALKAGLDMLAALKEINDDMQASGVEPLAIGIGLHTGPAVVGSVGSPKRMTFTAIGNTVNIASRVEGQTKPLGHPLVLTEATRLALVNPPPLIELPAQQIRGVDHPIALFAPDLEKD